jgi:integrase
VEDGDSAVTFATAAKRYEKEIIPKKAPKTQVENHRELKALVGVFSAMPLDAIEPVHVRKYLDKRTAKFSANREKALLSHIFNWARQWGYTKAANPCAGVKGHKEDGRDRYVEDGEYLKVYEAADDILKDAMDLAYYTGQRVADVLGFKRSDLRDGALWVQQDKTGKKLRIEVTGELARVIERILGRPRRITSLWLLQTSAGRLTYGALHWRFVEARQKAGVNYQLRDLRAKAATDMDELGRAQKLLGHQSRTMTEHYTRNRIGEKVAPLNRKIVED